MNTADKTAWTTALRSDEYAQGKGRLAYVELDTKTVKHCCLGVLCEIVGAEKQDYSGENFGGIQRILFDGALAVLPPTVATAVGLPQHDPVIDMGLPLKGLVGTQITLSELNDFGFTFKQIADIIDYFIPAE